MTTPGPNDLSVIQGLVARNYDPMSCVSHNVLTVTNVAAFKNFLNRIASEVTTASSSLGETCLNLGFTFTGLRKLGVDKFKKSGIDVDLSEKPELEAFVKGAVDRAETVGDVEENSPRVWDENLRNPEKVHVLLTIHGKDGASLRQKRAALIDAAKGAGFDWSDSRVGAKMEDGKIHFGYRDGISQPNIEGLPGRQMKDGQEAVPPGAFVLGYPSQFIGHTYDFDFPEELGRNGTFAAFRIMKQDSKGFDDFLKSKAKETGCDPELVAAQLCGRWRDGTPLVLSPKEPITGKEPPTNNFDYEGDKGGALCPFNAHIRRTNPRSDVAVAGNSGRKHRIVRATLPYGDEWVDGANDGADRGLVGLFFCVNLNDQFEFIMRNWVIRGGAQGSLPANQADPLIGLPSFVRTRGAAYLFYPSVDGLRYIAR